MDRQPPLRLPLVEYTGATLAPLERGTSATSGMPGRAEQFQDRIRSQDPYCRTANRIGS